MITYTTHEIASHALTPEGAQIVLEGSHEARVWNALPQKGVGAALPISQLKALVGDDTAKVGQGRAFKSGWIGKEGDGLVKLVRRPGWTDRIVRLTERVGGGYKRCDAARSKRSRFDWDFGGGRKSARRP